LESGGNEATDYERSNLNVSGRAGGGGRGVFFPCGEESINENFTERPEENSSS